MGSEGVKDERRLTYSSNVTKWMSESKERITRETRHRARWRRYDVRNGQLIVTPDGTANEVP